MNNNMGKKLLNTTAFLTGTFCIALSLTSCKEKGVVISMTECGVGVSDSIYVAPVETPQPRVVLIEEFTGVSCPPCPNGHKVVKSIVEDKGSSVAVVGIQTFGFIQAYPVIERGDTITKHDNRTEAGTSLSTNIYGKLSQTPVAGIDRILYNGNMYMDKSLWVNQVNSRLSEAPKANVTVTSNYNSTTHIALIKVRVAYTSSVSLSQLLTVALTEDKVVDAQEDGLTVIEDYDHEHVLRDILTAPTGSPILCENAVKEAGRVYECTFRYDLTGKSLWNLDNCKIVAYVSNAASGNKEVVQAAQVKLK